MMTREEVLAEMQADFDTMTEEEKSEKLFERDSKMWTPRLLLEEVRNDTEIGKWFMGVWEENKNADAQMQAIESALAQLLGMDPSQVQVLGTLPMDKKFTFVPVTPDDVFGHIDDEEDDEEDKDAHVCGPDCHHDVEVN